MRLIRPAVAATLAIMLAACSGAGSATQPGPSGSTATAATKPPSAPTPTSPAGAYRVAADHRLLVVDATGVLLDTGDGTVRLLGAAAAGAGWDVGSALGQAQPVTGHLAIDARGTLSWSRTGAATITATRIDLTSRDLTIAADGASIAATMIEPAATTGRGPAVVLVHEGGPRVRADVDLWARFWAAAGFSVLTYDKRGEGASTGTFPGDDATAEVVDTLAGDVRAAVRTLAAQPEVDPARVFLVGHSQAGWIAPAAATTGVAGLLLTSGSATDGAAEDAYDVLTSNSTVDPGLTPAQVAAHLAGVHGEYDPAATLRALKVPSLWIYGGRDQAVPAPQAAAAVRRSAPQATVTTLGTGDHFLYDTANGTFDEEVNATRYAPGLFPLLLAWAAARAA